MASVPGLPVDLIGNVPSCDSIPVGMTAARMLCVTTGRLSRALKPRKRRRQLYGCPGSSAPSVHLPAQAILVIKARAIGRALVLSAEPLGFLERLSSIPRPRAIGARHSAISRVSCPQDQWQKDVVCSENVSRR